MKRLLLIISVVLIVVVLGIVMYVKLALPNVGTAPEINIELTPERIERGKYLANHVMVCADCHSIRDFSKYSGPIKGTPYVGGTNEFTEEYGAPGNFYPPNLTPFHLKDWTDGEIYRAITAGVSKDGHALFPIMPYPLYGQATDEDIFSVIAYLRSLPSTERTVPASEANFPVSFLQNMMPQKGTPTVNLDKNNTIEYGKYLATVSGCIDCHTPMVKGKLAMDEAFSGGREFLSPNGIIRTSNITPHSNSGIGNWTEDFFVNRFKMYNDSIYSPPKVGDGFNTFMPWTMYAEMKESDLKAIYAYLQSIESIDRQVVKYTPK